MSNIKNPLKVQIPFAGFYETHHDELITEAIEQGFNYNYETDEEQEVPDIWGADIDYTAIHIEYCKRFVEEFADAYDLTLEFDDMTSPREYNFSTDRLFVIAEKSQIDKIRKEVYEHSGWAEYVKENFTDRDGFWSFVSSDWQDEDWQKDVLSEAQYEVIIRYWLNQIANQIGSDMEYESEIHLMADTDIYSWDSIQAAHEAGDKFLKAEAEENERLYLEYVNDYLTVEKFAEHKGLPLWRANDIIEAGRIENHKRTK